MNHREVGVVNEADDSLSFGKDASLWLNLRC
jgi:hypothetical protein